MPEGGFANAVAHKAQPDQTAILTAVQRPIAREMHSREGSGTGVENETIMVSVGRRGPHDFAGDAALHGGANERKRFGPMM